MRKFKKLEDDFYIAKYGLPRKGNPKEIWNKIKNNRDLLLWALKPIKDKWGQSYIVNGLAICDTMLTDYQDVDKDIYQKLINHIYANHDIARIVINGANNGGYSYLLMSLWNFELQLNDEQKAFAVSEAMNKMGTVKYRQDQEEFTKQLQRHNITDEITDVLDIDGCINLVGAKTKQEYMWSLFSSLSNTQAHGIGAFDIRYCILRNPNWSIEEKQQLIYAFWNDDEEYTESLEEWEWAIINDSANYKGQALPQLDNEMLYEYSEEQLYKFYGNEETTQRILNEIQFCKLMKTLRPKYYQLESVKELVI